MPTVEETLEAPAGPAGAPAALLADLEAYGERSSAFVTAGPGFESFRVEVDGATPRPHGCVRFQRSPNGRHWLGATEPIGPTEDRVPLALAFFAAARAAGASPLMLPVSAALSAALTVHGCHRLQVGVEPIFDLFDVFTGPEPLLIHPRARALARKGARLIEVPASELSPESASRVSLDTVLFAWQAARRTPMLGFLSRVAPFELAAHKRYFALELGGDIEAFVTALPVPAARGWYFAELLRRPGAKGGTMELLILEAMRRLADEGFAEVRLGLAPLAELDPRQARTLAGRALAWAADRRRFYDFRGNAAFKRKLQPTRWEALYLVTPAAPTLGTLRAVVAAHLPQGVVHALSVALVQRPVNAMLRDDLRVAWPTDTRALARRTAITTTFVSVCLLLHLLRLNIPAVAELHRHSGFVPGEPTALGLLLGPLWHNHLYHLLGDLVSFLFFGAVLEMLTGPLLFGLATAAGLWVSNPLTLLLVSGPLATLWPAGYANFLHEVDYGSSNAIYAFVGALAVLVKRPLWLLVPFFLNGVWVCVAKESWLALHHEVALAAGYTAARAGYGRLVRGPLRRRRTTG